MKLCTLTFLFLLGFTAPVFAQGTAASSEPSGLLTVGVLNGGGSLIGADYEFQVSERIGLQAGAGLVGFGAGVNYHLDTFIQSSAISLQFWNQGISGDRLSQRVVGMTYLYRSDTNGLTAQLGLGYVAETGKVMKDYYKNKNIANPPKVILMYSIGWYFN